MTHSLHSARTACAHRLQPILGDARPVVGAVDDGTRDAGRPSGVRRVAGVGGVSLRANEVGLVGEGLNLEKGDVTRLLVEQRRCAVVWWTTVGQ